jgi:hypothetical protein
MFAMRWKTFMSSDKKNGWSNGQNTYTGGTSHPAWGIILRLFGGILWSHYSVFLSLFSAYIILYHFFVDLSGHNAHQLSGHHLPPASRAGLPIRPLAECFQVSTWVLYPQVVVSYHACFFLGFSCFVMTNKSALWLHLSFSCSLSIWWLRPCIICLPPAGLPRGSAAVAHLATAALYLVSTFQILTSFQNHLYISLCDINLDDDIEIN